MLSLLERLRDVDARLEARYVVRTAAEYRARHPVPGGDELVRELAGELVEDLAPGEGAVDKRAAGAAVSAALDSVIESLLPDVIYTACERAPDTPEEAFERYLELALRMHETEEALSDLPREEERSEEVTEASGRLHVWQARFRMWMLREFRKMAGLALDDPDPGAARLLVSLFLSDDLFFDGHEELLSTLGNMPNETWEEAMLERLAALSLEEAVELQGFRAILEKVDIYRDGSGLGVVLDAWIGELHKRILAEAAARPSSEDRLLWAIFGPLSRPLEHPYLLLEQLDAASEKLLAADAPHRRSAMARWPRSP